MKKIYTLLFCILNVISLCCMEEVIEMPPNLDAYRPLMKRLYDTTYLFITKEQEDTYLIPYRTPDREKIIERNDELINIVKTINSTQASNITDHDLEVFAYHEAQKDKSCNHRCVPLFFNYIKQYNIDAQKKSLPDIEALRIDFFNTQLAQAITYNENNTVEEKIADLHDIEYLLKKDYPAYYAFIQRIKELIHYHNPEITENFIISLYSSDSYQLADNNSYYKDFFTYFYDKISYAIALSSTDLPTLKDVSFILLDILDPLEKEKNKGNKIDEKDLGKQILSYNPPRSYMHKFTQLLSTAQQDQHSIIKNRISLLCLMLKKYNVTRNQKKSPTYQQYLHYDTKNKLSLHIQENKTLNENRYALKEFEQLINDFYLLKNSPENVIQTLVSELYKGKNS